MTTDREGTSTMNVEIADRLAQKRRDRGLSQEELAEKLGVSRQAVSKWERSESSPDTDNLMALAQLYGVSLDELLYVDTTIEEDVAFEAKDRVQRQHASAPSNTDAKSQSTSAAASGDPSENTDNGKADSNEPSDRTNPSDGAARSSKVHIGRGGIDVRDENQYVHISFRDGIHVKDGNKGDEVHIDSNGLHVVEDGKTVVGDDDTKTYGDMHTAHDHHGATHHSKSSSNKGNDYTYDYHYHYNYDDHDRHNEFHKRRHENKHHRSAWSSFPICAVVVTLYLLVGFIWGQWAMGTFLLLIIPAYYMIVDDLVRHLRPARAAATLYSIAATAWFLWMAFIMNQAHPAWIIFLTIPIVHWACHSLSHWWRHRAKDDVVTAKATEASTAHADASPSEQSTQAHDVSDNASSADEPSTVGTATMEPIDDETEKSK